MSEQKVTEQQRLGPLEVRVAGDGRLPVAPGQIDQGASQLAQPAADVPGGLPQPQPQVGRDLIVAGAACMKLAGERAQLLLEPLLDESVYVLVAAVHIAGIGART